MLDSRCNAAEGQQRHALANAHVDNIYIFANDFLRKYVYVCMWKSYQHQAYFIVVELGLLVDISTLFSLCAQYPRSTSAG